MNENYRKILLLIRTSRPSFWLLTLVYLAAFFDAKAPLKWQFLLQMASYTFPLWLFANGINDIYDYESDRINIRKKRFQYLSGGVLNPADNAFIYRSAIVAGIVVLTVSLASLNFVNVLVTSLILLSTYYYSKPPLRLKNIVFMDYICNAVGFFGYYINGYGFGCSEILCYAKMNWLNVLTWNMGVAAVVTLINMVDYDSDFKAGVKNTVVRIGLKKSSFIPFFCFLFSSIFVKLDNLIMLYYIFFITAVYVTLIFRPTTAYAKKLLNFTMITYLPILIIYVISLR